MGGGRRGGRRPYQVRYIDSRVGREGGREREKPGNVCLPPLPLGGGSACSESEKGPLPP